MVTHIFHHNSVLSMEPSSARLVSQPDCHLVGGSIEPGTRFSTWNLVTPANGCPLDSATLGDRGLCSAYQARDLMSAHCAHTGNRCRR